MWVLGPGESMDKLAEGRPQPGPFRPSFVMNFTHCSQFCLQDAQIFSLGKKGTKEEQAPGISSVHKSQTSTQDNPIWHAL